MGRGMGRSLLRIAWPRPTTTSPSRRGRGSRGEPPYAIILLLEVPPKVCSCHTRERGAVEDIHSTCWATLLALEPASKTACVEDVTTGKLLAARSHLFTTDGTEMGLLELLLCRIGAAEGRREEGERIYLSKHPNLTLLLLFNPSI
jgi:hypothetical protein